MIEMIPKPPENVRHEANGHWAPKVRDSATFYRCVADCPTCLGVLTYESITPRFCAWCGASLPRESVKATDDGILAHMAKAYVASEGRA